jgi:hypothetical protein
MKYFHPNKCIKRRYALHIKALEHVDKMQGFNFARYRHMAKMQTFSFPHIKYKETVLSKIDFINNERKGTPDMKCKDTGLSNVI